MDKTFMPHQDLKSSHSDVYYGDEYVFALSLHFSPNKWVFSQHTPALFCHWEDVLSFSSPHRLEYSPLFLLLSKMWLCIYARSLLDISCNFISEKLFSAFPFLHHLQPLNCFCFILNSLDTGVFPVVQL